MILFQFKEENEEKRINLAQTLTDYIRTRLLEYKDIMNPVYQKLEIRCVFLLQLDWIDWIQKPESFDIDSIITEIIRNVVYKFSDPDLATIYITDEHFSNTNTPISRIVKFLDQGNELVQGSFFITNILNDIRAQQRDLEEA